MTPSRARAPFRRRKFQLEFYDLTATIHVKISFDIFFSPLSLLGEQPSSVSNGGRAQVYHIIFLCKKHSLEYNRTTYIYACEANAYNVNETFRCFDTCAASNHFLPRELLQLARQLKFHAKNIMVDLVSSGGPHSRYGPFAVNQIRVPF